MNLEPVLPPDPPAAPKPASKLPLTIGFLVGAVPWVLACVPGNQNRALSCLIFAGFAMPVIAVVLAIIPPSRRFGLGLLLASGIGWLVLGAMCSGVFRSR
jgi:predicted membrane channel-forming protein YqfA (hemolysin III family)